MSLPLPAVRALARRLLERESPVPSAEARVEATQRVLSGLAERISPLVGGGGFQLLLQRALKRARGEHAWLRGVRLNGDAPGILSGAQEAVQGVDPEEVTAAAEAVIAELIALIARFLGPDMAIRLVRQSFPEASWEENGSGTEGEQP